MHASEKNIQSSSLEIIQLYRALAAIFVFFYHLYFISAAHYAEQTPNWFRAIWQNGYYGVDFFFTLSGFIILTAHGRDQETPTSLKRYGLKRIIRIFPAYIPISIANFATFGFSERPERDISLLSSFFLIPSSGETILAVAWTLIHEMVFYTIFSVYFFWRKAFFPVMGLWGVMIVANGALSLGLITGAVSLKIFNPLNLEFLGGLVCALVWRRVKAGTATGAILLLSGVIGLVAAVGSGFITNFYERSILAIPFALILLGGCYLEKGTCLHIPRPLLLLGDASYALYLIHLPLIAVVRRAVPAINRHAPILSPAAEWTVMALMTIGAGILAGVLYHTLYERPVLRVLRRRLRLS